MKNLEQLLSRNNETKFSVEKKLSLPNAIMSNWISGKYKPSYDALIKLADYFGVSIDYLVGRETPTVLPRVLPKDLEEIIDLCQQLDERSRGYIITHAKSLIDARSMMTAEQKQNNKRGAS